MAFLVQTSFQGSGRGFPVYWNCLCECGNTVSVRAQSLRSGRTSSCGCLTLKHGHCWVGGHTPTYESWIGMRQRCLNPKNDRYESYGGRGIKISARWDSFANFLADMGDRPKGKSLDRINNDGNYEPGNCRWATNTEQSSNRRRRRWWKAAKAHQRPSDDA